jgi:acetylornithine deacetylase
MWSKEILARLVAMPTVSRTPNTELIDFATSTLIEAGFTVRHVEAGTGRRNLFASIGPANGAGVILSGHTDVVPVAGQAWSSNPFELVERDGLLFGRGTADMKGFIACVLNAATKAHHHDLKLPLHIALSCDEEIGCVGVRPLLAALGADDLRAGLCLIGEPTSMAVATSHKGKIAARATCIGREAHSGLATQGLNAIHLATDLVNALRDYQRELLALADLQELFEIPYSTIHVGKIAGGVALNIVPAHCTVEFEIRNLPNVEAAALLARIRDDAKKILARYADFPEARIEIEETGGYPGLHTPTHWVSDVTAIFGGQADRVGLSFGTEAGLFREAFGFPTLVCGPGSMDQGHKPDEYIAVEQLERCDAMLDRLLHRLSIDRPL